MTDSGWVMGFWFRVYSAYFSAIFLWRSPSTSIVLSPFIVVTAISLYFRCDGIQIIKRVLLTFACVFACVCLPSTASSEIIRKHIIQKADRAISLVYPPTNLFVILSWQFFYARTMTASSHLNQFNHILFSLLFKSFSGFRRSASSFHFLFVFFFVWFLLYVVLYWIERWWACSRNTK